MRRTLFTLLAGLLVGAVLAPVVVSAALDSGGSVYVPRATQCVLFDTRLEQGGTGPLDEFEIRVFALTGDLGAQGGDTGCEVDADATGYHINIVAISATSGGNLKAWAASEPEPNGGIANYQALTPNINNSNAFLVSNDPGGLAVKANGGSVEVRGILYGDLFNADDRYALTSDLATLEARVADLETLPAQLAGVEARLTDLEARVEDIETAIAPFFPRVFAVAYTNVDGQPGFNPLFGDVLIARLVDGPEGAPDGAIGIGDVVETFKHPTTLEPPFNFGSFTSTKHVASGNAIVSPEEVCVNCFSPNAEKWRWMATADREIYQESSMFQLLAPSCFIVDGLTPVQETEGLFFSFQDPMRLCPSGGPYGTGPNRETVPTDDPFLDVDLFLP